MVIWVLLPSKFHSTFRCPKSSHLSWFMFDEATFYQVLARAGMTSSAASQFTPSPPAWSDLASSSRAVDSWIPQPRKPKLGCNYLPSSFCPPPFLAKDCIHCWSSPFSKSQHNNILSEILPENAHILLNTMLSSLDEPTQLCYAAGLLWYTQFCDGLDVLEEQHVPASETLLASFVASWVGKISSSTTSNWLAGLHFGISIRVLSGTVQTCWGLPSLVWTN